MCVYLKIMGRHLNSVLRSKQSWLIIGNIKKRCCRQLIKNIYRHIGCSGHRKSDMVDHTPA